MLERIREAPAHALALEASGTVMARDVEQAVGDALEPTSAATGLVIVISRDFDGYLAELARGLANVSVAHKALVRIAVVTDADRMDETWLNPWSGSTVPIRLFATEERAAAYAWADAARRGE
jgi:SpoIIAA-like